MSRAGTPAEPSDLIDIDELLAAYYDRKPDASVPAQRVAFGTSGHRGSSLSTSFNEDHILATTQAIVDYRTAQGIAGPLFLGRDTHGLSLPAERTAVEVLVANGVDVRRDSRDSWVPTPALSHAILVHNAGRDASDPTRADGIVVTPSHNPPRDGGFKYNPPHGGPADTDATGWIANRANDLIAAGLDGVRRTPFKDLDESTIGEYDFRDAYVRDLAGIIDVEAIRSAGVRIGADPLGGASVDYWALIAEVYGLDLTVVNPDVDPTWRFMTLDWDEKIRMDPSSPSAMASLVARRDEYDILTGNDADADRHGIVTPDAGLMNPNHYLAVAIDYLYSHRPDWPADAAVGKTLVSSMIIDKVAAALGRSLLEVPVGFKWFVPGLLDGSVAFGAVPARGGDPGGDGQDPVAAVCRAGSRVRRIRLPACRRPGHARAEGRPRQARAGVGDRHGARGRADHRQALARPGQRRGDRRPEGADRQRVVRRAPVGHRRRLQALRRVTPRRGAPAPGAG